MPYANPSREEAERWDLKKNGSNEYEVKTLTQLTGLIQDHLENSKDLHWENYQLTVVPPDVNGSAPRSEKNLVLKPDAPAPDLAASVSGAQSDPRFPTTSAENPTDSSAGSVANSTSTTSVLPTWSALAAIAVLVLSALAWKRRARSRRALPDESRFQILNLLNTLESSQELAATTALEGLNGLPSTFNWAAIIPTGYPKAECDALTKLLQRVVLSNSLADARSAKLAADQLLAKHGMTWTDMPQQRKRSATGRVLLIVFLIAVAIVAGILVIAEQNQTAVVAEQKRLEAERHARIEAAWNARLQLARQLATSVDLNSDLIHCQVKDSRVTPLRATGDPRADLLLTVAEQPLIVLYSPGFNFSANRGLDSFDSVVSKFSDHIAIALAQPGGSALCVVRWATEEGFGPNQPHLAATIAALRRLSDDPLLLPQARRRLVVEGYSAGGNFAKWSVLYAMQHPLSTADGTQGAPLATLRLVMIATPHHGVPIAENGPAVAEAGAFLFGIKAILDGDDKALGEAGNVAERALELENSRGRQQLLPNNRVLENLDRALAAHSDELEVVNISSLDDNIVPPSSSAWPNGWSVTLTGFSHFDFAHVPAGSDYANALAMAYGESPIVASTLSPTVGSLPERGDQGRVPTR